jgi:hypothetical protein
MIARHADMEADRASLGLPSAFQDSGEPGAVAAPVGIYAGAERNIRPTAIASTATRRSLIAWITQRRLVTPAQPP